MRRLYRFIRLLIENWGHIWWASQYRYTFYNIHGTNSPRVHKKAKEGVVEHMKKAHKIRKFVDKTSKVKGKRNV